MSVWALGNSMNLRVFFALTAFVFLASSASAKEKEKVSATTCSAEITYKWTRASQKAAEGEETGSAPQVFEELWGRFESEATEEKEARGRLESVLLRETKTAKDTCRREHENIASCIAGKFESLDQTYRNLSFSARTSLEEAVRKDCEMARGYCSDFSSSEIVCVGPPKGEGEESDTKKK